MSRARGRKRRGCGASAYRAVARMEPTGRANARPMTGSAQSGTLSGCGGEHGKAETMAVTSFRAANPLFSPRMRSRASVHPRAQSDCLEWIGGFVRGRQNHVSRRDRARHRSCCPRRWIAGPCPGTSQARPLRRLNRATRRPAQLSREPVQAGLSARSRDRAPARRDSPKSSRPAVASHSARCCRHSTSPAGRCDLAMTSR